MSSPQVQGPQAKPSILQIDPYVPGRAKIGGSGPIIKLSSNETPLGPSPKAVEAYRHAAGSLDRYPDGAATPLREALGAAYGLNPDQIVCGTGSDDLLRTLAHTYLTAGDEAIVTAHGFLMFKIFILGTGATPVIVPEKDLRTDVDAILAAVTPRTRVVFIANPNNPTGTYIPRAEVERLRTGLPERVVLVLDAAYCEYITRDDYESGAELVTATNNTVMTRTFSKIYGLAGARLGWIYCPQQIADMLHRVRTPFNVPGPGIAAGIAALEDREHIERARAYNDEWLPWLTREIRAAGLQVTESAGNFVLFHCSGTPGQTGADADAFLHSQRIILRPMAAYGLPDALRVTVGTEAENRAVVEALRQFMNGAA